MDDFHKWWTEVGLNLTATEGFYAMAEAAWEAGFHAAIEFTAAKFEDPYVPDDWTGGGC